MKRLIVFDLDGVLVDSKEIHFNALNKALDLVDSKYVITKDEQEKFYEGLPTKQKLKMLTQHKGLSETFMRILQIISRLLQKKCFML